MPARSRLLRVLRVLRGSTSGIPTRLRFVIGVVHQAELRIVIVHGRGHTRRIVNIRQPGRRIVNIRQPGR
jgi:hypothetical protein